MQFHAQLFGQLFFCVQVLYYQSWNFDCVELIWGEKAFPGLILFAIIARDFACRHQSLDFFSLGHNCVRKTVHFCLQWRVKQSYDL